MAITSYLEEILSKQYGREVRDAIVGALETCYGDATGNPDSVAALVQGYIDRQDEFDTAISTVNGLLSSFGTIIEGTNNDLSDSISADYHIYTQINSISLTPGTWIVCINVDSHFAISLTDSNSYTAIVSLLDSDELDGTEEWSMADMYNKNVIVFYPDGHRNEYTDTKIIVLTIDEDDERLTTDGVVNYWLFAWHNYSGSPSKGYFESSVTAVKVKGSGSSSSEIDSSISEQVIANTTNIAAIQTNINSLSNRISNTITTHDYDIEDIEANIAALSDKSLSIDEDDYLSLGLSNSVEENWINEQLDTIRDRIVSEMTTRSSADVQLENDISIERARINNLVAGATPGADELVDIRVGDDGVTYDSAGEAVRGQFADVKSDFSSFNGASNLAWSIGGLYAATGLPYGSSNNVRSGYVQASNVIALLNSNSKSIAVFEYTTNDGETSRTKVTTYSNKKAIIYLDSTTQYIRLMINVTPGSLQDSLGVVVYNPAAIGQMIMPIGYYTDNSIYASLALLPLNTLVGLSTTAYNNMIDCPFEYSRGVFVKTISPNIDTKNSGMQEVYSWDGLHVARRLCVSGTWSDWVIVNEIKYRTFTVRADGTGDFSEVVTALRNTMSSGLASYYYRYIIDIDEGTFDLRSTSDLVTNGEIDQRGLFVMPYVTIKGKGKDKTKLTYYYGGSNDSIMSMVSGLNMPYESTLQDLTLSVKDVRYAIHSDNALSSETSNFANTKLNNNKITLKNVCLEHLGFSSNKTPTYKVPAAWGGGSWNATDREFINCDFISQEVCGFLSHDRVGITEPSNFTFKNCNFITYNSDVRAEAATAYSSCALISWGSNIKTTVSFENCMANKFIALTVVTNYNANAIIDYLVKADNDLFIIESTTNNAHLNDNFQTSGCIESVCGSSAGITAYTPVSKNRLYWVHRWTSGEAVQGIALNSCSQNELCIMQTSGFVAIPLLTSSTFSDGDYIGYSGEAWVVDSTNPIIRVMGGNVGVIL